MLVASAAALPVLLGAAGCRSEDAFTGTDPLAGPPRPSPDVITLQTVIGAEESLIQLYKTAIGANPGDTDQARLLNSLLAQHEQHLAQLRARLIVPAGSPAAQASRRTSPSTAPARVTTARLRAAERASAAGLVRRLATVEPALAQLFASIAASDATHATVLGG
jgi:hypothetical protein